MLQYAIMMAVRVLVSRAVMCARTCLGFIGVSSRMLTDFRPARNSGTLTIPSASSSQTDQAFLRIERCDQIVPETA